MRGTCPASNRILVGVAAPFHRSSDASSMAMSRQPSKSALEQQRKFKTGWPEGLRLWHGLCRHACKPRVLPPSPQARRPSLRDPAAVHASALAAHRRIRRSSSGGPPGVGSPRMPPAAACLQAGVCMCTPVSVCVSACVSLSLSLSLYPSLLI